MVRVPVSVLAAGRGVHIKDSVDSVLSTDINDPVEVLEPRLLENARVHVVCMCSGQSLNVVMPLVTHPQNDGN